MEKLEVFDCSNVFIASFFTDDRGCAHCNREHTLIYILSGELEITDGGRKTILHPGIVLSCAETTECGYRNGLQKTSLTVQWS